MAEPLLEVDGVSVRFGGIVALDHVSFAVEQGSICGLIGPNGAGKTTLIDAITGFVRHTGRVELDGQDVGALAPFQIAQRGCARTWQGTDLFDDLDVRENLAVATGRAGSTRPPSGGPGGSGPGGGGPGGGGEPDVDATLRLLGLDPIAEAMPAELSEGQRKLVGLARAMAGRPRLLCLDEPGAGLDTRESEALGERLRELADQGQSTLLIDHDMGLVLGICDRVVVLEFGRVIANDAPDVVRGDGAVIAAYLGGGAAAAAAAGDPAAQPQGERT
ncbi:MAG TPA: ABC transporter ATP-binding protein [Solirubrobacteraceae bacterium]|nr:ABC transporter ATP-binding protein [Solirubrobacteraceae bacterium]